MVRQLKWSRWDSATSHPTGMSQELTKRSKKTGPSSWNDFDLRPYLMLAFLRNATLEQRTLEGQSPKNLAGIHNKVIDAPALPNRRSVFYFFCDDSATKSEPSLTQCRVSQAQWATDSKNELRTTRTEVHWWLVFSTAPRWCMNSSPRWLYT